MHQYVDKRMQKSNYMVKDNLNPRHGKKLYWAVLHQNGYNIVFDNNYKMTNINVCVIVNKEGYLK